MEANTIKPSSAQQAVTYQSDRERVLVIEGADEVLNHRGRVIERLPRTAVEFSADDTRVPTAVLTERDDGKALVNGTPQGLSFAEAKQALDDHPMRGVYFWEAGKAADEPRPTLDELRDELHIANRDEVAAIRQREEATHNRPAALAMIADAALGEPLGEEPERGGSGDA